MKWHQAKCTHQESRICDIRSHVLILCTEHETLKRVSDYAQIIKPSPFAWLVGRLVIKGGRHQRSKQRWCSLCWKLPDGEQGKLVRLNEA